MAKARSLVGLDVHATRIVAAVLDVQTGQLQHFFYRRDTEHTERYRRRLIHQLERLGHKVTLQPLPEAA